MSHDFKCQVEEVKHENITFQVWDLAGQARRFTSFFSGENLLKLGTFAGEFACPLVYLLRGQHLFTIPVQCFKSLLCLMR